MEVVVVVVVVLQSESLCRWDLSDDCVITPLSLTRSAVKGRRIIGIAISEGGFNQEKSNNKGESESVGIVFESYTQRRWERKNRIDLRLQSSDDGDLNTYSMMFGENDGSTTPYSLSDDGDLTHSMMAVNWGGA